jgi:hypothetical protein
MPMDQKEWLEFLDGLTQREHWIVERAAERFTSIASGFGAKFLEELAVIRARQARDDERLEDLEHRQEQAQEVTG